jgi:hypothetical protein
MLITTLDQLTGYAQGGTVPEVTDKTAKTGYEQLGGPTMEAIILFLVLVAGFIALDLGSVRFGADSRDQIPDTHVR